MADIFLRYKEKWSLPLFVYLICEILKLSDRENWAN